MPTNRNLLIILFGLLVILTPAIGDVWNKKTNVTFREAVEMPTGVVLPPGDYVMKLLDSPSNRHIVQVLSHDERKVHATILAIPNQRMEPADKTVISFYETPSGAPLYMRAWFYPGDTIGQEFAYPKDRAYRISRATGLKVPIDPSGDMEPVEAADNRPASAHAATEPVQIAQAATPSSGSSTAKLDSNAQAPSGNDQSELPQTAGNDALTLIAGLSSLAAALALRLLWRQTSDDEASVFPTEQDARAQEQR